MKILSNILIIIILGIALSTLHAAEKVGTTSFQFLKVAPDARAAAMGGAISSIVNTSEAVFWNPAALRKIDGFDISACYVDYFLDVNISSVTLSIPVFDAHTVGLFALAVDYGEFEVTDVRYQGWNEDFTHFNPGLTGEVINPAAKLFGLSYAVSVTDKFNFGLTAKYAIEDLVRKKASTLCFDAGLTYETGWHSVKMAASVRNFGPEVTFIDESYPIPETFSFGISAYIFSPNSSLFLETSSHSLLLSYDITHPRDYDQQHNLGLEYSFMDYLFLRGGYKFNYDEEGMTLGVGFKVKQFRIDYAYDPFGEILESVHRFSIGFGLN